MKKAVKKEDIYNIPNALTFLRVLLTFFIFYFILARYNIWYLIIFYSVAALTDFFDGQIARRFNLKTEFGRKFDMIADRLLMIGTVFILIISWTWHGIIGRYHLLQIGLIMSREIVSLPFAIHAFISKKGIPHAKFVGKLTTFLQGFVFPIIILSIFYEFFEFSIYLALITGIIGIFSAVVFINDLGKSKRLNKG